MKTLKQIAKGVYLCQSEYMDDKPKNDKLKDDSLLSKYIDRWDEIDRYRLDCQLCSKQDIALRKWCIELLSKSDNSFIRQFDENPEKLVRYIKTGTLK